MRSGPGPHTADLQDERLRFSPGGFCTEGAAAADGGSDSRRPWVPPPRLCAGLPAVSLVLGGPRSFTVDRCFLLPSLASACYTLRDAFPTKGFASQSPRISSAARDQ